MADKKPPQPYSITRAELAKLPRNEQRRLVELGYVEGVEPPAVVAEEQQAKASK